MNRSGRFLFFSITAPISLAASAGVPPGPPALEIAGTVDTNVVNTVGTELVNTISFDRFSGADFGPVQMTSISVSFFQPVNLRAITTSVAPTLAGETCNVSTRAGQVGSLAPLGLSVMSNGQAATVSRNYEIPLGTVETVQWDASATGGGCLVSISVAGESIVPPAEADLAPAAKTEPQVRIEYR